MSDVVRIKIDTKSVDGYDMFIKCKKLPIYQVVGNYIVTDKKSYDYIFSENKNNCIDHSKHEIEFDYQRYVVKKALERERYAAFLDCGLGKTIIELLFAKDVINALGGRGVVWCPLSVVEDIQREHVKLFGYRMSNLRTESHKTDIAIVNYESLKDIDMDGVVVSVLDESSILKSSDGVICNFLKTKNANVKFRLCCSATPSPNDQTEYASHAVYLGLCATEKEFYSKFFVKDGTQWRMKGHAKNAFYDYLKSWCCYIYSPSSIGFSRGAELGYEPNYIIQESYPEQKYFQEGMFLSGSIDILHARKIFGELRSDKSQKRFSCACESISNRKAIIWCGRNEEERAFASETGATIINGSTPIEKRIEIIDSLRNGEIDKICTKPKVLAFGVNIPEVECHLFSGYDFSFEKFYQAVRRSHRYGRSGVLDVIIPMSEPERPIWELLNKKLSTFKIDTIELQKRFFD